MAIELTIAVQGDEMVVLRACKLHPSVFAPPGGCPLCQWRRQRHNPRRHLRIVGGQR